MISEKSFILPEKNKPSELKDTPASSFYEEFVREHTQELSLKALESEGFRLIPKENIMIHPPTSEHSYGILEIQEPTKAIGADEFEKRNQFEEEHPTNEVVANATYENSLFRGEKTPPESFHPNYEGRVCFHEIQLYETENDTLISIPILPDSGQRYGKHTKASNTSLIRGVQFPNRNILIKEARGKSTDSISELQKKNPQENLISKPLNETIGIWTVRLRDKSGRYSDIKGCNLSRDPETNTLDISTVKKHKILDHSLDLDTNEKTPKELQRVHALASISDLKSTLTGDTLPLKKLYYANKLISARDLPDEYKHLFTQSDEADTPPQLKEFKPVPALSAFLAQERLTVDKDVHREQGEIDRVIGDEFEQLVAESLDKQKNTRALRASLPSFNDANSFQTIIAQQPEAFKKWAQDFYNKNEEVIINPDFILDDGTFLEAKVGDRSLRKVGKGDQLYRMILYKLMQGENPVEKIRYLTLDNTSADPVFSTITYENILESDIGTQINSDNLHLQKIKLFRNKTNLKGITA